ncbi:cytochrome c biogenesis protein DipZ [Candidatus Gracilibacteria bacterium]|nr:cytochrome c biogenesis protein DipZ [Candidatus Gracilibacteria bacterium]
MTTIILISFFSGVLTVLAPCVLPLLPVILGGSLAGQSNKRPYIIIASLIVSLLLFTLLLKASTVLIQVDPDVWEYVAGGLLVLFSITLIFPRVWTWLMGITGIEKLSQNSLEAASHQEGIWGPIALGAALGPVFSSCNPTYTVLLATILPASMTMGLIGLLAYFVGLGIILLLIVHFGRSIIGRFAFFSNPRGIFRRILGVVILIVGLLVMTGYIKKVEAYIIEKNIFVNTFEIDNTLNDIILKSHNNKGGMCANGKCDEGKDGGLMMDVARAPELTGIATWINSNPLTMESLRGKVVLIDFWTYSCINCIRTQPYLNAWYDKYEKDGLVIIGVHAPEFAFEKIENNVREASQKAGIKYPIALDNDFKTWNAYANRYWPAKYLIDQNGNIVYKHFGEGEYVETEQKIQELLGAKKELEKEVEKSGLKKTPETYLGSSRGKIIQADNFVVKLHEWQTFGNWKQEPEYIEATEAGQLLRLNFRAKDVYLVVSGSEGTLETSLYGYFEDGRTVKLAPIQTQKIDVNKDDIYHVAQADDFGDHTLQIIASPGLRLHAFTFGD